VHAVVGANVVRLTAPVVLSIALLCACDQSLFDDRVGDDGGDAIDDDGGDAIDDDGGTATDDDGGDDGDDGGDDGDGGSDCPEPCQGDPVADFSLEQGGASGRWFYLVDSGEATGTGFDELRPGSYDGADAWVVQDDAGPAIVNCSGGAAAAVCAGVGQSLVFVPAEKGGGGPVLAFRPPDRGSYRLVGEFRVPDGFDEGATRSFLVARNATHDSLLAPRFLSSTDPAPLSVDVEALGGDQILLTLPPGAKAGTPIAFDFAVTLLGGEGEIFPGKCLLAATFDGEDPLRDLCAGQELANLNDDPEQPDDLSAQGDSLVERYGSARVLAEGQYLRHGGSPMDYRADFTIQFWARLDEPQPAFDTVPFADWSTTAAGGVVFRVDEIEPLINVCYMWDDGSGKPPMPVPCLGGSPPRDGEWHFYRLSRSASAGTISLCIDGDHQDSGTDAGSFDMTSDEPPYLGRSIVYEPAYFAGSLDDVRVFARALPCTQAP
jgi:Concanavalin A-like lectin/glucanases superfamily